jgi:arylsulfatase A-like enzyme
MDMRRKYVVILLLIACCVTAAAVAFLLSHRVFPKVDLQAPNHYFINRDHFDRERLRCDFTIGFDRFRMNDLWALPLQPCSLGYGWSEPTRRGIAAFAKHADLEFFVDSPHWTHLVLRVMAVEDQKDDRVQKMRVRLNDRRLATVEIPNRWTTIGIEIPPETLRAGTNTFKFSFTHRAPLPGPHRQKIQTRFAARIQEIELAASPPPRGLMAEARRWIARGDLASPPQHPVQIFDQTRNRFVVRETGTLVIPMRLPATAHAIEIEIAAPAGLDCQAAQLIMDVQGLTTGTHSSTTFSMVNLCDGSGDRAFAAEVPIDQIAGEDCVLSFAVQPEPAGSVIEIGRPRPITHAPGTSRASDEETMVRPGRRPDIVLITLDASRPDRFSCYGYDRPTTPNIDRLGEESLVFTNVFALSPNTRISVPTMITGFSYLNHQVTEDDSTLGDEATTLAEYLQEAGYRTACFSANPNNSRAIGDDQGYDEFFELWTEVPRTVSKKAEFLTERALEWLAGFDDAQPLHLQLHFIPPHAPYEPAPEFDLFTDPAYDGWCDGTPNTLRTIDKAIRRVNDADLAQITALYDGNLRAVDASVARVLDALKSRERWQDTVVLVTSDHGEAFFEHRRMLHNNTVYDEMLRVPFILRLPGGRHPDGLDLNRPATLADIVPTLLATASLQPSTTLDGADLLQPRAATDAHILVARTAYYYPLRALRTPRWKLVLTTSGQARLYDLAFDPGEHQNVGFENLPTLVGLGQLLTQRLMAQPSIAGTRSTTDAPLADQEMLKALGYVE